MKMIFKAILAAALLAAVSSRADVQTIQQIGNIFVIAMENHNFTQPSPTSSPQQISNNPAAWFMNTLITPGNTNAQHVSFAVHYYNSGVGVHPSEPNYVWSEGGTDFGYHSDNDPTTANGNVHTADHLMRQLNVAGIPWRDYQEDVQLAASPTNSASGTSGTFINPYYNTGAYNYGVKHNPMAFYNDTQTQNVYALTNLFRDLTNGNIGRYNWITPNQYDDAHSALSGGFTYRGTTYSSTSDQAAVAQGDNFLSIVVPKIMASDAYKSNGVIIIWFDETEGGDTTSYTLPYFVISPLCKGNAYASAVQYSHSSLIKTVEELFNLPFLTNTIPASETAVSGSGYNNVATVNDLSDMFLLITPPMISVPANINVEATNAAGDVVFFAVTASDTNDGPLMPTVSPPSGSLFPLGTNTVTATVTNSHGLSATNQFLVIVSDTTPPVITILGPNPFTNFQYVAYTDPGATAFDVVSGNVAVTTNSDVDVTTVGTYSVEYTASDAAGNSATNTRTVQVIPLPAPANLNGALVSGGDNNGAFQLSFSGAVGQPYRILASADMTAPMSNWSVLASGVVTNNPATFTDLGALTNAACFYRIVSP